MMNVVLPVRVGVTGVLCHLDSSTDIIGHYDGWWFSSALSCADSLMVTLDLMSDIYIRC